MRYAVLALIDPVPVFAGPPHTAALSRVLQPDHDITGPTCSRSKISSRENSRTAPSRV